ncbi:MAG: hypothetical protein MRZ59_00085 [Clostridiales bacterium]|nr:hypothetical protein [Clostridiales bacterium]MDY3748055.1 hypothetical protein [Lachnospiraceae bacterium]
MQNFVGYQKYANEVELKVEYLSLGKKNEEAAILLEKQGLYNEAVYMYIQSMEKKIKGYICGKINVTTPYFAEKLREIGHSLDKSTDFLIEILAGGNNILKMQLNEQIKSGVFQNINFSQLHNNCRYPKYNYHKKSYSVLYIKKEDCLRISEINRKLDSFINSFDKL